jgi:RNA-directed DNA polymerase
MKLFKKQYPTVITIENLFLAWKEFLRGKRNRNDVAAFQARLADNIFTLAHELKEKTYTHSGYRAFNISDPKPRIIHKAPVRDRLLHHLLYREFYGYFDSKFIFDSYSCRLGKGTHRAIDRFRYFAGKVSKNNTKTCWILKCDIRKFFANIDHQILKEILAGHIADQDILALFGTVIDSFETTGTPGVGLPLGNLTSQLLVNVYMNEFDQFVKRKLKVQYYIRYADDFVFLSDDKAYLEALLLEAALYLETKLKLVIHDKKIFLSTYASGMDFLGWIHFSHHRQIRTATKRRMMRRLKGSRSPGTLSAYKGMLSHGNTYKIQKEINM